MSLGQSRTSGQAGDLPVLLRRYDVVFSMISKLQRTFQGYVRRYGVMAWPSGDFQGQRRRCWVAALNEIEEIEG
jgi:hypothetical protein